MRNQGLFLMLLAACQGPPSAPDLADLRLQQDGQQLIDALGHIDSFRSGATSSNLPLRRAKTPRTPNKRDDSSAPPTFPTRFRRKFSNKTYLDTSRD